MIRDVDLYITDHWCGEVLLLPEQSEQSWRGGLVVWIWCRVVASAVRRSSFPMCVKCVLCVGCQVSCVLRHGR